PFRVFANDTEAYGTAIVLHIHAEAREADSLKKRFSNRCQIVECISKRTWSGHLRIAKTRIVRRDNVEMVSKGRDEIAILVRGSRKAVKQDKLRSRWIAAFTIENGEAVDLDGLRQHDRVLLKGSPIDPKYRLPKKLIIGDL